MDLSEMIKGYYSNLLPLLENAIYNEQQDITKFFGESIMVIYNGHGGTGWDIRTLVGIYENDPRYFLLEMRGQNGECKGQYLLKKEKWFTLIVLPENIEKMNKLYNYRTMSAPIKPDSD
jgi:hypothetical protein